MGQKKKQPNISNDVLYDFSKNLNGAPDHDDVALSVLSESLQENQAFSKSINAQKTFIFLNFSSSKLPWITKVLSRVEHFFLKIVWFSFKRRNSC
jgi:hypothetical protein